MLRLFSSLVRRLRDSSVRPTEIAIVWVPITEFVPGRFHFDEEVWTGEMNGEAAWTEGHIMCLGKLPPSATVAGVKDFAPILAKAERDGLVEILPVAVAQLGKPTVIFSDGHTIDVKFYSWVHVHWPAARWFGDEASKGLPSGTPPIVIREAGKLVALVMALRFQDGDLIRLLLSKVRTGPTRLSQEAEKSTNKKKARKL